MGVIAVVVRADDRDGEAIAKQATAATAAAQSTAAASQTTPTAIRGAVGPMAATVARAAGSNVFSPIPRAGLLVVHHPTDAGKVRQWTGTGAPQWVELATATFAECAVTLTQIGTTGIYQTTLDLPDDATYPIHLYATDATAFDDQVIAQMTWYPEPATSGQVSQITAKLPSSAYLAGSDSEDGAVTAEVDAGEIISGVVGALAGQSITITTPYDTTNQLLTIVRGDSYLHVDGRAITVTIDVGTTMPNDISDATVSLKYVRKHSGAEPTVIAGDITTAVGNTKVFRFDLTSEQTQALSLGRMYDFEVEVLLEGDDDKPVTPVSGEILVVKDLRGNS